MQPQSTQDYKQLLTEVIKKQIVILGPDITLSKARNVKGLTVANDGTVTAVEGQPQEVTQALIDQFVQLSGLIVKKTMEPLLSLSTAEPMAPTPPTATSPAPTTQPLTTQPTTPTNPTPTTPTEAGAPQPLQPSAAATTPPPTQQQSGNPTPTNNPLAA